MTMAIVEIYIRLQLKAYPYRYVFLAVSLIFLTVAATAIYQIRESSSQQDEIWLAKLLATSLAITATSGWLHSVSLFQTPSRIRNIPYIGKAVGFLFKESSAKSEAMQLTIMLLALIPLWLVSCVIVIRI